MPGSSGPMVLASRASWRMSERSASPAPGYCTLTATSRPSCQRPLCTCPMLAAAVGPPSSHTSLSCQPSPRSWSRVSRTVWVGIGGAESCSFVRCSRYGPAISSGSAASSTDSAWPNFIAPPLSSPRVRNSCSAVFCWMSFITASAGAPPSRLPSPSALRPAYPKGSAARRAVRAAALRGRSAMVPVSQGPPDRWSKRPWAPAALPLPPWSSSSPEPSSSGAGRRRTTSSRFPRTRPRRSTR